MSIDTGEYARTVAQMQADARQIKLIQELIEAVAATGRTWLRRDECNNRGLWQVTVKYRGHPYEGASA